ncbi:MAG: hypothetical protein H6627_00050 [Calditrichae bacterium]|nr:hypothetical protein [Calditrichota bacterium]MCB9056929.1 hypothetical protein [Calditrichia bacterium]
MKKCVFLTMENPEDFVVYDSLLIEPLERKGWQVHEIPWTKKVDWNDYQVVIIRSTWDYQNNAESFLQVLKEIDQSNAQLENSLAIVKWNIDKIYLQDLEQKGIKIVPTVWMNTFDSNRIDAAFSELQTDELIIKPRISANADFTYRLTKDNLGELQSHLEEIFSERSSLLQPFMNSILDEGEFSLFYFGGTYSHSILKKPKNADFRVQEEHGGTLKSVEPEDKLLDAGKKVMDVIKPLPLYVRVDFVRDNTGEYLLMELELIEPSLYFNMDDQSAQRFADAFEKWME